MATAPDLTPPSIGNASVNGRAHGLRDIAADNSLHGLRGRTHVQDAPGWGNSAPLALTAFAVCAFMLSMVNANLVNSAITPYIWGVAFMFGGITQLIAGLIQLRTGNTFTGVLFSAYGGFWLSLFAIAEFFQKSVPAAQHGHALGLFLYAFGAFTIYMLAASLRTNVVTITALVALSLTLFLLAAGNYSATAALVRAGGYTGLALAALAAYLSASAVFEAAYGRDLLPTGDLSTVVSDPDRRRSMRLR